MRSALANYVGIIGIVLNLILALLKYVIALRVDSIAIMADAGNNLMDTLSSIVIVLSYKMASRKADANHPYGHGRWEYIAGIIVSFLVLSIGFSFAQSSYERIVNPTPLNFSMTFLIIIAVSILAKVFLALLNAQVGKQINSQALQANAYDSWGDVVTTVVVILPLILSRVTAIAIDGYIGIAVSLMIIYNGFKLIRETISPLIGEPPDEDLLAKVSELILAQPHLGGIHSVRYENRGNTALMTVDVEVDGRLTVREVHKSIDFAERKCLDELNVQLVIHTDPVCYQRGFELQLWERLQEWAKLHAEDLAVRDFYLTRRDGADGDFLYLPSGYDFAVKDDIHAFVELIVGASYSGELTQLQEGLAQELAEIEKINWHIRVSQDYVGTRELA